MAPPDPAGNLAPGTPVGSDFEILEYVAAGGMGFIYRGLAREDGREVAIKVMRDQLRGDEASVKRFEREARTVARLNHPNTIELYDFGSLPTGQPYIVMEFLQGCDLADYLSQFGVLDPARAAFITSCAARACAEAHDKGVVHRDLKPENIFLVRTDDGTDQIKVLDFGIAKIVGGPPATQITRIGMVCGTPDFMSPEQGRGEDLDGRSDVYALGCMLYTLLVGKTPFDADTPLKVVMRHQLEPFPDLPADLPVVLNGIIKRATQKNRDERFADARVMANTLDTFVATANAHLYANRMTGIMPALTAPPRPFVRDDDDTHLPGHHSRIATEMLEIDTAATPAAAAEQEIGLADTLRADGLTEEDRAALSNRPTAIQLDTRELAAEPASPAQAQHARHRASTVHMPQLTRDTRLPPAQSDGNNKLVVLALLLVLIVCAAIALLLL